MKDINLPPFYVGQKVVALKDASNEDGISISEGNEYTIFQIFKCKCSVWKVDVGLFLKTQSWSQCSCGDSVAGITVWRNYNLFAPIETTFETITFEEVIKIESPLICKQ